MKRIIVFILAFALLASLLAVPCFAETRSDISAESSAAPTAEYTPETENAAEGEISGESDTPFTQAIVDFITENYTGSSLIALAISVVTYIFYAIKSGKRLNGSITKFNNNAVAIAQSSKDNISDVTSFKGAIESLLKKYEVSEEEKRKIEEEKKQLADALTSVSKFLNASKLATIEMSNEVAELLVLANIPNALKDEILSRHNAAVQAISAAEGDGEDDGIKA